MPAMGSMPCSSRTPVSFSTIPVLLSQCQPHPFRSPSAHLRDSNSPADLAHVKVLISRPSPAPWRVARTLLRIFRGARSSGHIARLPFSLLLQFVGQCMRKGAVSDARRVVSKRAFAPSACINVEVQLGRWVYNGGDATARDRWVQVGGIAIDNWRLRFRIARSRDDFQARAVVVSCRALLISAPTRFGAICIHLPCSF